MAEAELNSKAREVMLELTAVASSRTYSAASSIVERRVVVPSADDVDVRLVREEPYGDGDVLERSERWSACGLRSSFGEVPLAACSL